MSVLLQRKQKQFRETTSSLLGKQTKENTNLQDKIIVVCAIFLRAISCVYFHFVAAMLMATSVGDHPRKGKLSQLVTAKKKRRTKSVDSNCSSITDPMSPDRRDYKRRFNMDKLDKPDRQSVPIAAAHSYEAVAAIDFGTTYSGYAYAFTRDPDNIHLMNQRMVSHRSGYGVQQPTVLLLNNKGEFHSFGYDAQEFFHDLDEEECGQWLYFEKFKMELHSREVRVKKTFYYHKLIH